MKKFSVMILSVLFCLLLVGCGAKSPSGTTNSGHGAGESQEEQIISLFIDYAQRDSNGSYRFRKQNTVNNVSFLYNFVYSPAYEMYNANILVTSYTSLTLYDYASVTFSWGNFKNGLFTAYHELDSIARIEFEYKGLNFTNNSIGAKYSYTVQSNSFVNLTEKSEIDEYAATGHEVLQQAIGYMNSVLRDHGLSVALY